MSAPAVNSPQDNISQGLPQIVWRVFWIFGILAVLSLLIYLFGSLYGERMTHAGHSADKTLLPITIGSDNFQIPANMIRHGDQRIAGRTERVDIYLHWPTQSGYNAELAPFFSETAPNKVQLIVATLAKRRSILDMADRLQPVYLNAIDSLKIKRLKNGLIIAPLLAEYGYVNEKLVYSLAPNKERAQFIARCQTSGNGGDELLLPCETDIFVGNTSEIKIRFASSQLLQWQDFAKGLDVFIDRITIEK